MEGRFISRDPIGFDGGDMVLYGYVENNPIIWIDPDGLNPVAGAIGGFTIGGPPGAIVGGIIGAGIGTSQRVLRDGLGRLVFKSSV